MNRIEDTRPLARAEALAQNECEATLDMLLHLNEIERHELHLNHGYASMFDFATRHLRYSESAAGRRIQVARCLRRFPTLVELFRAREVNLSTVAQLGKVIDDENDTQLIARIRGKSQREVEKIVAEVRPPTRVRDEVRPIGSSRSEATCAGRRGSTDPPRLFQRETRHGRSADARGSVQTRRSVHPVGPTCSGKDGAGGSPSTEVPARPGAPIDSLPKARSAESEPRFKIQFSASAEFKQKLDRVRSLLSGRFPGGVSLEEIFEAALEALLDRECPIRREQRREKRREARRSKRRDPAAGQGSRPDRGRDTFSPDGAVRSRRIPPAIRDAVHVRDAGQCTFVGLSGRRCSAKHDLEIDHIVPFAKGGSSTIDNLRLLCAKHNRLEAEQEYGKSWMHRFRKHAPEGLEAIAPGKDS